MIRARQAGDAGLLIEAGDQAASLAAAITSAGLPGVLDIVPGARTVLVVTEPGHWSPGDLTAVIGQLPSRGAVAGDSAAVQIPVVYDGEDLADVAQLSGLSVGEVIEAHAGSEYTVGWLGFAPGFGYLTGLDDRLAAVPRLPSPRVTVPAGSVAIAGGLSAVYPSASPGGWRLIGRTSTRMWDQDREPPALLAPGRRVRFIPQPGGHDEAAEPPAPAGRPRSSWPAPGTRYLEVITPGPLATVQDLGRHGYAAVGVPPAGAADAASLAAANRLAGNEPGAAGLELTLGRAEFRCTGGCTVAVAGAPAEVTLRAGRGDPPRPQEFGTAFEVPDGWLVGIGPPSAGLRSYLAVGGGLATRKNLGSRSADLHSGIGGPLRSGAILPVGDAAAAGRARAAGGRDRHGGQAGDRAWPPDSVWVPARGEPVMLRIVPGPRADWFEPGALRVLCEARYAIGAASNRTGLRLDGPALARATDAELPSEGVLTGSLQVPHDGKPILLLTDHPTVGGYPVIAVLASADIGLAAQLRPGDLVTFTSIPAGGSLGQVLSR
jgi:KipI family sensor histidine kinase inhibitor